MAHNPRYYQSSWAGLGVWKAPAPGARADEHAGIFDRYLVYRDAVEGEASVELALVGRNYEPLQNRETFGFVEPFVDYKWATFESAGALGNGERVWVVARLRGDILIGRDDTIQRFRQYA